VFSLRKRQPKNVLLPLDFIMPPNLTNKRMLMGYMLKVLMAMLFLMKSNKKQLI